MRDEAEVDLQAAALERLIDSCDQIAPGLHTPFIEPEADRYPMALTEYSEEVARLVPEVL
jgi:hypothetical protein